MVSKRERAKQRKAAAEAKSSTSNNAKVGNGIRSTSRRFLKALNRMPTTKIVGLVKQGDVLTTTAISESKIEISYQKSGLSSAVLGFLQRCEHETLDEVIDDSLGQEGKLSQLKTPVPWINILMTASIAEPSCSLKIVESIGPLVECMCDDMTRLCFKSNKHWRESIYPFAGLIHKLLCTSANRCANGSDTEDSMKVIDALLKHECLLQCIIQWGFWESRPDIVNELPTKDCEAIVDIGIAAAKVVIAIIGQSRDWQQIGSIGSMSIINEDYDPTCMVSYTEGLLSQMKRQGSIMDEFQFSLLQSLLIFADCVDEGVINEIIGYGTNNTSDLVSADRLTSLSFPMILQMTDDENCLPCDTRTASAIRAGLIEMCLNFIGRFGDHESFRIDDDDTLSLFDNVENAFEKVHEVSLHQKTAKAIRSKRQDIESELVILQENDNIQNNPNSKILLGMVKSILGLNGSYCCRCNKPLSRTEVMECNGCGCMVYCSRACQKEDWFNGHSLTCCKSYTPELSGQFQGRFIPIAVPSDQKAAAKLENLEKNITMIQLKLFLDDAKDILRQAKNLDIPLHDCVAKFDLRQCPLMIEVYKYTEFYDTPELKQDFEESRSNKNITCVYYSYIFNGEELDEDGDIPRLIMQRFFPHKWLTEKEAID